MFGCSGVRFLGWDVPGDASSGTSGVGRRLFRAEACQLTKDVPSSSGPQDRNPGLKGLECFMLGR